MTTTPSAVFYLFWRHCTHWFIFLHEIFSHRQITSYLKFLRVVDHQLSQRLWKKCVSYKRCRKSFVQVSVVVTKKLRWSQRVFLIFLFLRTGEYRDSRIRSGEKEKPLLWLKSHFHADTSCQTRQFNNNSNREQWKLQRNFIDYEYSLLFLKSSARGTQNILCKLGKETRREWVIEMGNVKRARKRKRLLAI